MLAIMVHPSTKTIEKNQQNIWSLDIDKINLIEDQITDDVGALALHAPSKLDQNGVIDALRM